MATLGALVTDTFYDKVVKAASREEVSVSMFVKDAVVQRIENGPTHDPTQLHLALRATPAAKGASRNREVVLDLLRKEGPATKFELAKRLNWPEHWVSPRLTELLKGKQVVRDGKKANPNSGRPCSVWIVKPKEAA